MIGEGRRELFGAGEHAYDPAPVFYIYRLFAKPEGILRETSAAESCVCVRMDWECSKRNSHETSPDENARGVTRGHSHEHVFRS